MTKQRYIVIQEWMRALDLNASELLAYALIWGFYQDGESDFHGSVAYVADWCKIKERQAHDVLRKLTEKGYIEKVEYPGHTNHYKTTPAIISPLQKLQDTPAIIAPPTPAIIADDNKVVDNKRDIKETHSLKEQPEKIKFGQRLEMTQKQYDSILAEYGPTDTPLLIQLLDDYLINHPTKKVLDAPAAIRNWVVDKLNQRKIDEQRLKNAQEAGQRVKQPQAPVTHYADLAEIDARRKAIEDKYKN